ncbi:cell wall integrity and stress response component 2-like [Pomacea canaliculata]|uniref:cell wall integrity and stress response component 2-like n=1 Tax=Pomacea canaliculata TaxID=400727 RepID=UPI000D72B4BE|nr:cell wall integrity and stress response component 2-like [Pomacea canaliculata]
MPSQLTVRVTDGVGGYCVLIKESNLQVDEFIEQKIDLPQANGRIAFVAKSGANSHDGNITLKNVKLTSGPCAGAHANTSTPGPIQPPECVNFTTATTTTTATTRTTATTTAATTTTTMTTTGTRTSTASTTTTTSPTARSTESTTAAVSPTASYKGEAKDSSRNTAVIIACVIVLVIILIVVGVLLWWKTKNGHKRDVHPLEDKQAADPPGLEPAINNPPHSHFMVTDTGQRWADKSSTDVTSTDELVANEQPTDTTGNVSPNGHDQDQIVDIDETLDFDYDTNDDPYDFEYMNTAPFSGLLNR